MRDDYSYPIVVGPLSLHDGDVVEMEGGVIRFSDNRDGWKWYTEYLKKRLWFAYSFGTAMILMLIACLAFSH